MKTAKTLELGEDHELILVQGDDPDLLEVSNMVMVHVPGVKGMLHYDMSPLDMLKAAVWLVKAFKFDPASVKVRGSAQSILHQLRRELEPQP